MFSDPVSFTGDTRVEVITVLANCGADTDRARRALVTWIKRKQDKGRSTEHILDKLRNIELKFIKDTSLHSAFRDARAETRLPRPPDLPLPSFVKRRSTASEHTPDSVPSVTTPTSKSSSSGTGHGSTSSIAELPRFTRRTSPSISSRLSRDSSQMSDIVPEKPSIGRRVSLPRDVPRVPPSRSPRIHIPRDRPSHPSANSPVTSSPEESELYYLRYPYMAQQVVPSQPNRLVTPVSAPPEFLLTPIHRDNPDPRRRSPSSVAAPPSARIPIPNTQSQWSIPYSPQTSSDELDIYPRRYRSMSQSTGYGSPGNRRVTPPRATPPEVPLPPIPSDDQGSDSDSDRFKKGSRAKQPLAPVRPPALDLSNSTRPLPIQPIPTPVLGPDEAELTESICENSLQQNWLGSTGDLPADIVVRQDSPIYMFRNDHAGQDGVSPPPPYLERRRTLLPPDVPILDDPLEKALHECGCSPEIRDVVSKCIEFHRGYEPPYWQSHLQACGLDEKETRQLVDEMCKQVDWAASFRKAT